MRRRLAAFIVAVLLVASTVLVSYYATNPKPQPQSQFSLNVFPTRLRADAVAGELVVFLVTITNNSTQGAGPSGSAELSAAANDSAVLIQPSATIVPGQVAEVEVVPDVAAVGSNVTVSITAQRAGFVKTQSVKFGVIQWYEDIDPRAAQLRDQFVQWLQVNHPQFGITNQTIWQGSFASARVLVVSHYLFYSKNWEMHVYWHNMIPPYDWARIDLRERFNQTSYSYAFEISDLNASVTPHIFTPTTYLWR